MKKIFASLVLLTALLAVGCGKDADHDNDAAPAADTATAPAATPEASAPAATELKGCGWVTEEEASTALGIPVKYRSNDPQSSNCILDEKAKPDGGFSVDFQVWDDASGYDMTANQKGASSIEGLGEKATYSGSETMGSIAVVKNGKMFSGTFSDFGKTAGDLRAKAEALAKVIVAKM